MSVASPRTQDAPYAPTGLALMAAVPLIRLAAARLSSESFLRDVGNEHPATQESPHLTALYHASAVYVNAFARPVSGLFTAASRAVSERATHSSRVATAARSLTPGTLHQPVCRRVLVDAPCGGVWYFGSISTQIDGTRLRVYNALERAKLLNERELPVLRAPTAL